MKFEDFLACVPDSRKKTTEKYKDSYFTMLDLNGAIPQYTVCFHLDYDNKDEMREMLKFFKPTIIWFGNEEIHNDFLSTDMSNYYHTGVFGWFEDGVTMVVSKIPVHLVN